MVDKQDKMIEAGAGIAGIIGFTALIYVDAVPNNIGIPIILSILSGLGAYASGQKRGKRITANAVSKNDDVFGEIASRVSEQMNFPVERVADDMFDDVLAEIRRQLPAQYRDEFDETAEMLDNDSEGAMFEYENEGSSTPENETSGEFERMADDVADRVAGADRYTLQKVGKALDEVDGGGSSANIRDGILASDAEMALSAFKQVARERKSE